MAQPGWKYETWTRVIRSGVFRALLQLNESASASHQISLTRGTSECLWQPALSYCLPGKRIYCCKSSNYGKACSLSVQLHRNEGSRLIFITPGLLGCVCVVLHLLCLRPVFIHRWLFWGCFWGAREKQSMCKDTWYEHDVLVYFTWNFSWFNSIMLVINAGLGTSSTFQMQLQTLVKKPRLFWANLSNNKSIWASDASV